VTAVYSFLGFARFWKMKDYVLHPSLLSLSIASLERELTKAMTLFLFTVIFVITNQERKTREGHSQDWPAAIISATVAATTPATITTA
jgi:hypothetical protein